MSFGAAVDLATLISVLIAIVALIQAARQFRRQSNVQVFLEYTSRYESVLGSLPPPARVARLCIDGEPPEGSDELTLALLKYLNLCSEEFYLRERGYLEEALWSIWADELKRILGTPLMKREWKALRSEFTSYPDFRCFVDEVQGLSSNE